MGLLTDSVILLVWFLVFLIILFLYIDIRVGKLRKELLAHYALCEKMVSAVVQTRSRGYEAEPASFQSPMSMSTNDIFPKVVSVPPVDDDFIPTREEMAQGLLNLERQPGYQGQSGQQHGQQLPSFQAFDAWEFQGEDYAPFRLT